jgi:perosamine synthetase
MTMPVEFSASDFVQALQAVLGEERPAALHEPEFAGNEWTYVKECLDTGWVSSVGKFVDEFELRLAAYTGARHAVAVVNGTAALHVALLDAGVRPGDEVLCPALTFIATANAVSYCGAIPHFVDSCDATLGIDPQVLSSYLARIAEPAAGGYRNRLTGRRLAAVVPTHTFGHPVDLEALAPLATRYGLELVEDAAESLGSWIGERHTGTYGRTGVLSFNGNKVITTGGGGAIITNDTARAKHLKHLTTTAKQPHHWAFVHDEVGFNYRMPNINAALGCAQIERLPDMLQRKRALADRYRKAFSGRPAVRFVDEPANCRSNFWLNAVHFNSITASERDALLEAANNAGLQCRPAWQLMHQLPMYSECPRAPLPVAEALERGLISLPSSPNLIERLA